MNKQSEVHVKSILLSQTSFLLIFIMALKRIAEGEEGLQPKQFKNKSTN